MEKINQKENRLFDAEELQKIRAALPGQYYKSFCKIWKAKYKSEPPIRQSLYAVLNGASENDQMISVLIQVINERNELKNKLMQAIHGSKQEAAAAN